MHALNEAYQSHSSKLVTYGANFFSLYNCLYTVQNIYFSSEANNENKPYTMDKNLFSLYTKGKMLRSW